MCKSLVCFKYEKIHFPCVTLMLAIPMATTPNKEAPPKATFNREAKDRIGTAILRELSMDARQSLSSIAEKTGASKTAVFNELNSLIEQRDIKFVPEINLEELWRHELLYTTKWMQKREFRQLDIHQIGFTEYVGFVKFIGKKPSDAEIAKAVRFSYIPQNVSAVYGRYDLFMYLVARDHADINVFVNAFNKSLPGYKMVVRIRPVRKSFGFFPLRNELIEQFKLPEKYKKLLVTLNNGSRGQLSQDQEVDKNAITYIYKTLIEYGIVSRTTMYMRNPDNDFAGIISYSIVDHQQFQKSKYKWFEHLVNMDGNKLGTYTFMADVHEPYGGIIIVNAKNAACFEGIKKSIEGLRLGIEIESTIFSRPIIGELGVRNFDLRYSNQYGMLATEGLVPKVCTDKYAKERVKQAYIEI